MRKTANISQYTLEHENGKILPYIDRNCEAMSIFILESITVSSSVFLLLRFWFFCPFSSIGKLKTDVNS